MWDHRQKKRLQNRLRKKRGPFEYRFSVNRDAMTYIFRRRYSVAQAVVDASEVVRLSPRKLADLIIQRSWGL